MGDLNMKQVITIALVFALISSIFPLNVVAQQTALESTITILAASGEELSTWTRREMNSTPGIDRLVVDNNFYTVDAFFNNYAGRVFIHQGTHNVRNNNVPNSPILVAQDLIIVEGRTSVPRMCQATNQANVNTTQTLQQTDSSLPANNVANDRYAPFRYTQSEITIPNRQMTNDERQSWIDEYNENGGASEFELEVIRLTNDIRVQHGLYELIADDILMKAARFYTQTLADLNLPLGHREGPYGGPHARLVNGRLQGGIVLAFGFRGTNGWAATAGNANRSRWTPEALVESWMNSPAHRDNILNPDYTLIGFGTYLGGATGQSLFHYQIFH